MDQDVDDWVTEKAEKSKVSGEISETAELEEGAAYGFSCTLKSLTAIFLLVFLVSYSILFVSVTVR